MLLLRLLLRRLRRILRLLWVRSLNWRQLAGIRLGVDDFNINVVVVVVVHFGVRDGVGPATTMAVMEQCF